MAQEKPNKRILVCITPQGEELSRTGFEALEYILIEDFRRVGAFGSFTDINSFTSRCISIAGKSKDNPDAGDPVVTCGYNPGSAPGQEFMVSAGHASNENVFAFKLEHDDAPLENMTNTVHYLRGIVAGPIYDDDLITFQLGLNQEVLTIKPHQ